MSTAAAPGDQDNLGDLDPSAAFAAIDATWPAAAHHLAGGFLVRQGLGGGSRVSSATLEAPFDQADIDAAIACQHQLGQPVKFQLRPGQDALDAALAARGFELFDETAFYQAPIAAIDCAAAPDKAYAHWPPLALCREILAANGIGEARQAVMERAPAPKAVLLGRVGQRAAGAGYIAIHQGTAMLHGLCVEASMRRHGLARVMIAEALDWARRHGATRLALVVRPTNTPACTLYRALGLRETLRYHYRREAQA